MLWNIKKWSYRMYRIWSYLCLKIRQDEWGNLEFPLEVCHYLLAKHCANKVWLYKLTSKLWEILRLYWWWWLLGRYIFPSASSFFVSMLSFTMETDPFYLIPHSPMRERERDEEREKGKRRKEAHNCCIIKMGYILSVSGCFGQAWGFHGDVLWDYRLIWSGNRTIRVGR